MNDIYFQSMPRVGDMITLVEWEFPRKRDMTERTLGPAVVTGVESRTEPEWNPVFKRQEDVESVWVTLQFEGQPYIRRAIFGGIPYAPPRGFTAPPGAPGSAGESPDLPSPPPAL